MQNLKKGGNSKLIDLQLQKIKMGGNSILKCIDQCNHAKLGGNSKLMNCNAIQINRTMQSRKI